MIDSTDLLVVAVVSLAALLVFFIVVVAVDRLYASGGSLAERRIEARYRAEDRKRLKKLREHQAVNARHHERDTDIDDQLREQWFGGSDRDGPKP